MSKGKEKTNGSDQKGTAVEERAAGHPGGQEKALAGQSSQAPALWSGDPSSYERRFAEELDRFFEGFGIGSALLPRWLSGFQHASVTSGTGLNPQGWAPTVDVFQSGDRLIIRADLPGLSKEDIHVELENNTITIQGERRQEHEESREGYFHSERSYGNFCRTICVTPDDGVQDTTKPTRASATACSGASPCPRLPRGEP